MGALNTITALLIAATLVADLGVIYQLHGLGWTIVAIIVFPATMIAAPIMAFTSEYSDKLSSPALPSVLTGVLVMWLIVVVMVKNREEAKETDRERRLKIENMYQRTDSMMDRRARETWDRWERESE